MRYVIIDTGLKGACVVFEDVNGVPTPIDYYLFEESNWEDGIDPIEFARNLKEWGAREFHIEKPPTMPNQAITTTWKQAYVVGQIYSTIMLEVPRATIHDFYPIKWVSHARKHLEASELNLDNKKAMQKLAPRQYPNFMAQFKKRLRYHDGIADCIGMAFYVRRDYFSQFIED